MLILKLTVSRYSVQKNITKNFCRSMISFQFSVHWCFIIKLIFFPVRRSPLFDLYTADQVHLLPGYPINSSNSLRAAFYVKQPVGLFIGNLSVLPRDVLVFILKFYKPQIETAIDANISDIQNLFESSPLTEYPTMGPLEPGWKWTVIGIGVGLFVQMVAIIYIVLVRLV